MASGGSAVILSGNDGIRSGEPVPLGRDGSSSRSSFRRLRPHVKLPLLHPGSVTLRGAPPGWEGSVHLSIGQALPDGRLLKSVDRAVPLQLSAEQRDALLAQGMTLSLTIDLRPEVHQIRLAARDAVSGAVGSLTIPAGRLRELR